MRLRFLAAFMLLWSGGMSAVQAQSALTPNTPISSSIAANGAQNWTFQAYTGGVWSFHVEGEADFDPMIALTDSSGRELTANDDYDYPNTRDALLEAVTVNRIDTYTLTVRGFEGGAGAYQVTMLPGFARELVADDFAAGVDTWQPSDANQVARAADGALELVTQGGAVRTPFAVSSTIEPLQDFYLQARVVSMNNNAGWIVGATLRRTGNTYYLVEFNQQGLWRFSLVQNSTLTTLRDWTPHPNIVAGTTAFTFGVMARGSGFDVFYNNGFIGQISDITIRDAGTIGLAAGTVSSADSRTTARFDDLLITVPFNSDGAPIIPDRVIVSDSTNMTAALKRNHVVSASGTLALTVPDVMVEFARAGVNRQMVGQATRYTDFALGTTIEIDPASVGVAGCGLIVRQTDETNYTVAYLDTTGGYGISQRSGDAFAPGLFGVDARFVETPANAGRHHLLLIADRNTLYFYVDGHFVGTAESDPQAGEVGTAVINFDDVITTCRFADLWLWRW